MWPGASTSRRQRSVDWQRQALSGKARSPFEEAQLFTLIARIFCVAMSIFTVRPPHPGGWTRWGRCTDPPPFRPFAAGTWPRPCAAGRWPCRNRIRGCPMRRCPGATGTRLGARGLDHSRKPGEAAVEAVVEGRLWLADGSCIRHGRSTAIMSGPRTAPTMDANIGCSTCSTNSPMNVWRSVSPASSRRSM
jgi:hypothetical protein